MTGIKTLAVAGKTNQQFTELRSYPEVAPKTTFVSFALIRHPESLRGGHLGLPWKPPLKGASLRSCRDPLSEGGGRGRVLGGGVYNLFIVKEKVKKPAQMMATVIQSIPILNSV